VDDNTVVEAVVFKTNVIQARAGRDGAAPPWFHTAMTAALAPTNERLNRIEDRLDRIEDRLFGIERTQAIILNRTAARGAGRHFVVLPFLDRSDPTAGDNPFPLLETATIVENLSANNSKRYYRGYHGAGAMPSQARRTAYILHAIGCEIF